MSFLRTLFGSSSRSSKDSAADAAAEKDKAATAMGDASLSGGFSDAMSVEDWESAMRNVFRKALLDQKFRETALAEPRNAFKIANGHEAPPNYTFRFVEQLDSQVLVLPSVVLGQTDLSEIDISRILHHSLKHQPLHPIEKRPAKSC